MTRKHYISIAAAIASVDMEPLQRLKLVQALADVMQADNPNFDRARFLSACIGDDA